MVLTGLVALCLPGAAAMAQSLRDEPPLRPDAPYTAHKSDPISHEVDLSIVVTPPYHCKVLKVWIPVPQTDAAQRISQSRFSTFPMKVTPLVNSEERYGNRFAYFEFHDPQGAQIVRHRFKATVWNMHWGVDPDAVEEIAAWPESFEPYLKPQSPEDAKQFDAVLRQMVPDRQGVAADLSQVMSWIDANMTYDHASASLAADAKHAFTKRRGHCSDYHGLCATMGRALGCPARVTYGLSLFPKNSPSHCKMEAFLPPYGWVSFDLSETQMLIHKIHTSEDLDPSQQDALAAAARERLTSGFRENSWLLLTRGTGYQLVPPASQPVQVVRTAYIEADGKPLPDPDPANVQQHEFAWMTVHDYRADRPFKLPFKDLSTLSVKSPDASNTDKRGDSNKTDEAGKTDETGRADSTGKTDEAKRPPSR
jgi:transglutaminase-like putative cysteine protease